MKLKNRKLLLSFGLLLGTSVKTFAGQDGVLFTGQDGDLFTGQDGIFFYQNDSNSETQTYISLINEYGDRVILVKKSTKDVTIDNLFHDTQALEVIKISNSTFNSIANDPKKTEYTLEGFDIDGIFLKELQQGMK